MTILSTLLKERSPLAIGAVLVAFNAVCADRLDLLHQHYRRLCVLLGDADEWGQVTTLNTLFNYARRMLSRPIVRQNAVSIDFSGLSNTDP
jgi:AP-3 complex subunit beta